MKREMRVAYGLVKVVARSEAVRGFLEVEEERFGGRHGKERWNACGFTKEVRG